MEIKYIPPSDKVNNFFKDLDNIEKTKLNKTV